MDIKRICRALLFPHIAILIILLPVATALLVYSMVFIGTESVIAIISYVLAAYTLAVWCARIPKMIKFFSKFKNENKYAKMWLKDTQLRMKMTLFGTLLWNLAYAIMQLGLGFYHSSFWFVSLSVYYISLALMRLFLVRFTGKHLPGEDMKGELLRYRACGWIFLVMTMALSLMVFFMVYWGRTFIHHMITTIAMAAFTFTSFTFAIINVVRYRKYNSPVYSAAKAISFASACVSMLTLESTMLTTFGATGEMTALEQRIMLGASGGAISAFIIAMAVYMIVKSTKKLKLLRAEEKINEKQ
ncbi:MAG: hypothetical protein E7589_05600 [Ruminococcaceae bacterium]|nr:hypothetical protein [Oscillospiraceae bacterium]